MTATSVVDKQDAKLAMPPKMVESRDMQLQENQECVIEDDQSIDNNRCENYQKKKEKHSNINEEMQQEFDSSSGSLNEADDLSLNIRSKQRLLSTNDIDTQSVKGKKARRRRGRKRWKPYHKLSTEEKLAKDERDEKNAVQKREKLFSHGKPMAPYNTTQFLLEDREKRITRDSDGDSMTESVKGGSIQRASRSPTQEGCTGLSGSDQGGNSSETVSVTDEHDELGREFDAEYDSANLARIDGMSREEVIREMMHLEKSNGKLVDRVSLLQQENEKLKRLLEDNKINFEDLVTSTRRVRNEESINSDVSEIREDLETLIESKQQNLG